MFGLLFPMLIDVTAETVYAVITVAGLLWAGIERMLGKTRALWNKKQAVEAVVGAYALTTALNKVPGVSARPPPLTRKSCAEFFFRSNQPKGDSHAPPPYPRADIPGEPAPPTSSGARSGRATGTP